MLKFRGGYIPRIAGRPLSSIEELPLPETLRIHLTRKDLKYSPVIENNDRVQRGDPLAVAHIDGGDLFLPSPAAARVQISDDGTLVLEEVQPGTVNDTFQPHEPSRISGKAVRETLARGGIWPFFWSSQTRDVPALNENELPKAIIVNTVLTEPFRSRGKVILTRAWDRIVQGLRFLPRLLADYGKIHIILTAVNDPVAQKMYQELSGYAWAQLHPVPLIYPIENPRLLTDIFIKKLPSLQKSDTVWVIGIQAVAALGACLADGIPLFERILVTGGPGWSQTTHWNMPIGTPLKAILDKAGKGEPVKILRSGLFTGQEIDPATDAVQYDDDGFFSLPEPRAREFLSFVRPGFNRVSYSPTFASLITGAADTHISTSLRGERRPCIACGLCEKVCPARIIPQVLHRYLYRNAWDEAEKAGLDLCVDCMLCTYVCPSKIELQQQFFEARAFLKKEHEEAAAMSQKDDVS